LLVAAIVAVAGGVLWPALATLAVPGAVAMVLLAVLWRRSEPAEDRARVDAAAGSARPTSAAAGPSPVEVVRADARSAGPVPAGGTGRLPARFMRFAAATAVCTGGLVTFGLVGFHLVDSGVVPTAWVPALYAVAMAAEAVAALGTGVGYDRVGARVLLVLPVLVAVVPALVFTTGVVVAVCGVIVWGAAVGVQDSTVKAFVADLVPRERRATAYGVFAAVQGVGALVGGAAGGVLYEVSRVGLVVAVAATQVVAFVVLLTVAKRS
jgi:predicted MFS family arabinose efflux permease